MSRISFKQFQTNFVIIWIIYHGSGGWTFKRDAKFIIGIIVIWFQEIIRNVRFRCVVMMGLETRVGKVVGIGGGNCEDGCAMKVVWIRGVCNWVQLLSPSH